MKGNQQIIDALNAALTIELTAINQYFIQAKMCKNWGFAKLGAKHYHESIGEMKHADMLIDRILFLDGVPEIARYGVIRAGNDVKEQFEFDLQLETSGVKAYNDAVALAITLKDGVVAQSNFGDFVLPRISDMPEIAVHVVPSAEPPTGMGEPGLPPLAPAFANALAQLTGKPLRELPFKLA